MSNKTPKEKERKTKSGLRVRILYLAELLLISLALVFAIDYWRDNKAVAPSVDYCSGLKLHGQCYPLERAESNQARIKGLSDRESLPEKTGMLFIFENPSEQCIWMKDMNFSLDIIWLNEAKEIIMLERGVEPSTYPSSFCAENTKYVIEIPSGEASGLSVGETLDF